MQLAAVPTAHRSAPDKVMLSLKMHYQSLATLVRLLVGVRLLLHAF